MTVADRPRDGSPDALPIAVPSVDSPPDEQPVAWRHRHLLDVDALSWDDIELVMRTTDAMREVLARPIAKVPALRGRNVTILFYEASTRTRVSFEVAAKNLSADVVNIAAATSSVAKGESLVDTVKTVEALGAQMLVMRHSVSGAPYLAAETFSGSGPRLDQARVDDHEPPLPDRPQLARAPVLAEVLQGRAAVGGREVDDRVESEELAEVERTGVGVRARDAPAVGLADKVSEQ